ncbi:hypothetical protein Hanom_Chr16g01420221 [Helianthus anomalus]
MPTRHISNLNPKPDLLNRTETLSDRPLCWSVCRRREGGGRGNEGVMEVCAVVRWNAAGTGRIYSGCRLENEREKRAGN